MDNNINDTAIPTLTARGLVSELYMQNGLRIAMGKYMEIAKDALANEDHEVFNYNIALAATIQKNLWQVETKLAQFFSLTP